MAAFFAWRIHNAKNDFAPIFHDYRDRLTAAYELKKVTAPDDLVFYDAGLQDYELPLYSERLVGLGGFGNGKYAINTSALADGKSPTVFKLLADKPRFELLNAFDPIWVDGTPDYFVYRVARKGKFGFDPTTLRRRSARAPDGFPTISSTMTGVLRVTANEHPSLFLVVELLRPGTSVTVKAIEPERASSFHAAISSSSPPRPPTAPRPTKSPSRPKKLTHCFLPLPTARNI